MPLSPTPPPEAVSRSSLFGPPSKLSSSLSPWDPAILQSHHPTRLSSGSPHPWHDRTGLTPELGPPGPQRAARTPAPRPRPALARSRPRPPVAAAPAPAPQAAAVVSPPPSAPGLAAAGPPVRLSVRGDRPVLGGGRGLRARGAGEWSGGRGRGPPGGARPVLELERGGHRLKPRLPPVTSHCLLSPDPQAGLGDLSHQMIKSAHSL